LKKSWKSQRDTRSRVFSSETFSAREGRGKGGKGDLKVNGNLDRQAEEGVFLGVVGSAVERNNELHPHERTLFP